MCVETHNCASLRVGAKEINGAFYYVLFVMRKTMGKSERVTVGERGEESDAAAVCDAIAMS